MSWCQSASSYRFYSSLLLNLSAVQVLPEQKTLWDWTYIGDVDESSPLLGGSMRRGGGPLHLRAFPLRHKHRTNTQNHSQIMQTCGGGWGDDPAPCSCHALGWTAAAMSALFTASPLARNARFCYLVLGGGCSQFGDLGPGGGCGFLPPRYRHGWLLYPPQEQNFRGCTVICFRYKYTENGGTGCKKQNVAVLSSFVQFLASVSRETE